jgi:hypothetical protein
MILSLLIKLQVFGYRFRLFLRSQLWKAGFSRRFVLFGPKLDRWICQKLFDDLPVQAREQIIARDTHPAGNDIPVFLHIPKTGGISVGELFDQNLSVANYYNTNERPEDGYQSSQFRYGVNNPDLEIIQGHFDIRLLDIIDRRYKAFTILRDPVERAASFFYYLKRYPNEMFPLNPGLEIENMFDSKGACFFENFQVRFLCGKPTGKLTPSDLELAKKNLDKCFSFVGTLETIQQDIVTLGKIFDFSTFNLRLLNANDSRPEVKELPEATRQLIVDNNLFDIQLYEHVLAHR